MSASSDFKPLDPELAHYTEDEPRDSLFNEELRTLSPEARIARALEEVRRECDELKESQAKLQWQLNEAEEVFAECDSMRSALVEVIRTHPELLEEIVVRLGDCPGLASEITALATESLKPPSDSDLESVE